MRQKTAFAMLLALSVAACGGGDVLPAPSAPSARPASAPIYPVSMLPRSYPNLNWQMPTVFSAIAVGDVISQRVSTSDPLCDPGYIFHCQFYRITASRDGTLEAAMTWTSAQTYPLDIDVTDPDVMTWELTFVSPNERRVKLPVKAGNIYWVSVWSAEAPGEPFMLRTSLGGE